MAYVKFEGASPHPELRNALRAALAEDVGEAAMVDILKAFFHTGGTMSIVCATLEELIAESDTSSADRLRTIVQRVRDFPAYWENAGSHVDNLVNGGASPDPELQAAISESLRVDTTAEAAYQILCRFAEAGGWRNVALTTVEGMPRFDDDAVNEAAERLGDWVGDGPDLSRERLLLRRRYGRRRIETRSVDRNGGEIFR